MKVHLERIRRNTLVAGSVAVLVGLAALLSVATRYVLRWARVRRQTASGPADQAHPDAWPI